MVRRLSAGAEWIRTFSSALERDRQRFRGFVRVGADLPPHRSSERLPAAAYRSICQVADALLPLNHSPIDDMEDMPVAVLAGLGFTRAILLVSSIGGESAADKLFMIKK